MRMQCVIFAIKLSKRFSLIICKLIKVKRDIYEYEQIYILENCIEINMSKKLQDKRTKRGISQCF